MDAPGLAVIGLAAILAGAGAGALTLRRRRSGEGDRSAVAEALLNAALTFVVVGLILGKLHPLDALGASTAGGPVISFTPLAFVFEEPALALAQAAAFVPFGFLLALRFPRVGLLRLLLAGAVLAAALEIVQLMHPMRRTLLDDVIVSAVGSLLGGAPVIATRRRSREPAPKL